MSREPDADAIRSAVDTFVEGLLRHRDMDDEDQEIWSPVVVRDALQLVARLCGPKMLAAAYGSVDPASERAEKLEVLSERLWTVSHFFAVIEDPNSGSSIMEVADEAYRIANGDQPQLFAAIDARQGKRANSFTLTLWQLRALEWEAYLNGLGIDLSKRRAIITAAYGITWDAMAKWRQRLPRTVGHEIFAPKIATALRLGQADAWATDGGADLSQLDMDGETYRRLLGYG
jgi:hypothetical protein